MAVQVAIETLTRMVQLGKSKPVVEEESTEEQPPVDVGPEWESMVGSLRGELQRAYGVIMVRGTAVAHAAWALYMAGAH